MHNSNYNPKFKKKIKLLSLVFLSSLFLLSGCSKYDFKYGNEAYKDFIKIIKDHFGWKKDNYLWGKEDDDQVWNNYAMGPILKNDIKTFLDGENYKTNLNNTKNWSAIYWFPKVKVTGTAPGSGDYNINDINDSNIELIGVGNYLAKFYKDKDYLKPYLKYNFLQMPTNTDPSGHFTMLFSLNGYSDSISDLYKITYDFQLSDTAGSFIDNSLSISNIQNLNIINELNSDSNVKNKQIAATEPDYFKDAFNNFFHLNVSSIDQNKLKVVGYSLLDKSSDLSLITYDPEWNLINKDSSTFIRSSDDYFSTKKSDQDNFWFNDGSLNKIYFSYENPNNSNFLFFFSFSLNWQADKNNKINRSDDKNPVKFTWGSISDSEWVKA